MGDIDEQTIASSATISSPQSYDGVINNYGQTADVTLTLLACLKGMNFVIRLSTTVNKFFYIDPAASEVITLDGVALTGGFRVGVTSAAVNQEIHFNAVQTGAATWAWDAKMVLGPWINVGS